MRRISALWRSNRHHTRRRLMTLRKGAPARGIASQAFPRNLCNQAFVRRLRGRPGGGEHGLRNRLSAGLTMGEPSSGQRRQGHPEGQPRLVQSLHRITPLIDRNSRRSASGRFICSRRIRPGVGQSPGSSERPQWNLPSDLESSRGMLSISEHPITIAL